MRLKGLGRKIKILLSTPRYLKLVYALFRDERVPLYLKIFAAGAVSYFFFPFDIIPDVIPVSGYVDDLILIFLVLERFIAYCPEDVVNYHFENLKLDKQTFGRDFSYFKSTYRKIYEFIKNNIEKIIKEYLK